MQRGTERGLGRPWRVVLMLGYGGEHHRCVGYTEASLQSLQQTPTALHVPYPRRKPVKTKACVHELLWPRLAPNSQW